MFGICDKCGNHVDRYSNMNDPCEKCGGTKFWCHHISFFESRTGMPDHWVLVDVQTGKSLGPDMCDSSVNWKYEPKIYLTIK